MVADQIKEEKRFLVPLLPLRDVVVFPHIAVNLFVGRPKSVSAIEAALEAKKPILLVTQKESDVDDPGPEDLYSVGTVASVMQVVRLPDATVKLLVEGTHKARIHYTKWDGPYAEAEIELLFDEERRSNELTALTKAVTQAFEAYGEFTKKIPPELLTSFTNIEKAGKVSDLILSHLPMKIAAKQRILEMMVVKERLGEILLYLENELAILRIGQKIKDRVRQQIEKAQRDYYLNEQMQAIQKELGERDEFRAEIQEIEEALQKKPMPALAKEKVERELKKLRMISPMAAEAAVIRNYIDWVMALPWNHLDATNGDMQKARQILNEMHFGLDKVKERVLEHIAVQNRVGTAKGQILCFVGPPGVGKSSLARAIAQAVGRKFVKVTLGGVRDEAEIRGHRRTYVGAMPGKLVQMLRRAGSSNPVFLLDEIDKMGMDYRGDPVFALLEVLDPEQNSTFNDHYLELDYDLSHIFFIATANSLDQIPIMLRDRMEIIRIAGYTDSEKFEIAKNFLSPKQFAKNGLKREELRISPGAITRMISHYSREAGVRNLEREIATLCRKAALNLTKQKNPISITRSHLKEYLGAPKFRHRGVERNDAIGLCNGLAWTEAGGELLAIEVSVVSGKGELGLTGKLGEVMKESARAALSYVRSRGSALGLKDGFYQELDLHVHVPEGAIPKDGPSAGISIATALASALLKIPVRRDIAMTGEITLRGRILAVGGLKEKLLSAVRADVKKVLLPKENEADLEEVPKEILKALQIIFVDHMDQVLKEALIFDSPIIKGEFVLREPQMSETSPSLQ